MQKYTQWEYFLQKKKTCVYRAENVSCIRGAHHVKTTFHEVKLSWEVVL